MTTEKAVPIIRKCAKLYENNLMGKNILFVTEEDGRICFYETSFRRPNFMHLTGVDECVFTPEDFYYHALKNTLKSTDFKMKRDRTTEQKLEILSELMLIHNKPGMMLGAYGALNIKLQTDLVAGSIRSIMGFQKLKNSVYVPNTALNGDVRDVAVKSYPIIATFIKYWEDKSYTTLSYLNNKKFTINDQRLRDALSLKVDFENLQRLQPTP
ncbi:MAG: PBECR4 domain-containing protein [Oscillospiraceae bacterium]|nr:PBECR4 domain-containing protein [Oscillospiraceae bacterium]